MRRGANNAKAIRPLATRRRKVSVELYFVLYLSAIILLLGTTPLVKRGGDSELEEAIVALSAPDFNVRATRAALVYAFIPAGTTFDTSGVRLQRDSVNRIVANGSFSDIRFDIVAIHDSSTGQRLPMEYATLAQNGRVADFLWNPRRMDRDGVYLVTVCATATPLPPGGALMRPELRDRIAQVLREHGPIRDSVTFTVSMHALTTREMLLALAQRPQPTPIPIDTGITAGMSPEFVQPPLIPGSAGTFIMNVQEPTVRIAPREAWTNRIYINGIPNTTSEHIQFDVSGNAQIVTRNPGYIELQGIAPTSGKSTVMVKANPRNGGQPQEISFVVNTAGIDHPRGLPTSTFIEGQSYDLNFTVSDVAASKVSVEIRENNVVKVSKENGQAVFTYTPTATGTVRFTQYLGDRPIRTEDRQIQKMPLPSVTSAKSDDGAEAIVRTLSYGVVRGEDNRVSLKIESGNASDPEEISTRYQYDAENHTHIQFWRVRKENRSKPFEFSAYAIDKRGSRDGKSEVRKFNVDRP